MSYISLLPATVLSALTGRWFTWIPARSVPAPVSTIVTTPVANAPAAVDGATVLAVAFGAIALATLAVLASRVARLATARGSFEPCASGRVLNIVETLRRSLKIGRPVACMVTAWRTSPFSLGTRHPIIVLPDAIADRASDKTLTLIAAHEMTHIRHHDFARNLLQKLVRALFAFNPVVWIVDAHLDELREVACDQDVLNTTDSDRQGYAQTLLDLNIALCGGQHAPGVALLRRHSNLRRRIAQMKTLKSTDSKIKVTFLASLLILTFVILSCSGEDTTTAVGPETQDIDVATAVSPHTPEDGTLLEFIGEDGTVQQLKLRTVVKLGEGEDGRLWKLHEAARNDASLAPDVKRQIQDYHDQKAYLVTERGNNHVVHREEPSDAAVELTKQFHKKYGYEDLTKEQLNELHGRLKALVADGDVLFEFKDGDGEGSFIWHETKDE